MHYLWLEYICLFIYNDELKNFISTLDKSEYVCYNIIVKDIGVSPSGKAVDSDSTISRVQILPPQPVLSPRCLGEGFAFDS